MSELPQRMPPEQMRPIISSAYSSSGEPQAVPRFFINSTQPYKRGGMATLYEGWDNKLKQGVMMKRCHLYEQEYRDYFSLEAQETANYEHPYIVRVYDYIQDEYGNTYMVMENLATKGFETLDGFIQNQAITKEHIAPILYQISEVMLYLQNQKDEKGDISPVYHRDMKPTNIMVRLSEPLWVKVIDFGLATSVIHHNVTGAFTCLSPEMLENSQTLTPQHNVYTLGLLAYEIVSGVSLHLKYSAFYEEIINDISTRQHNIFGKENGKWIHHEFVERCHVLGIDPIALGMVLNRSIQLKPTYRQRGVDTFMEECISALL